MSKPLWQKRFFQVMVFVVLFGVVMYFVPAKVFQPFREALWFISAPFSHVFRIVGVSVDDAISTLTSIDSLKEQNKTLRLENARLQSEIAAAEDARQENNRLREELELLPRDEYELVSAVVIARDPRGVGDWMLINKGRNSGIAEGMAVIAGGSTLVGVVDEALYTTSKVQLITHPESAVNARDIETEAKGIVRGKYGLGIVFDMVLQTDAVEVGDRITTSQLGEKVPPGLLIGRIQEVRPSEDALFQQAVLVSPLEFGDLAIVSVIKSAKE